MPYSTNFRFQMINNTVTTFIAQNEYVILALLNLFIQVKPKKDGIKISWENIE